MAITQLSPDDRDHDGRRIAFPPTIVSDRETIPSTSHLEVRELRRIDIASALRVAVAFAFNTCVVWAGGVAIFGLFASSAGLTARVDHFARSLGFQGFHLVSMPVFLSLALIGILWIIGVVVAAVVGIACFNVANATVGPMRLCIETKTVDDRV